MSSPPSGDADPPPKSHSEQLHPSTVQATEQQLKARAEGVSIEDYLLPRSITVRLAKSVLPPNTSVQKDAVLAIQKAATVFVSYLSSHANEATLKRTVSPADVLNAISELEFEGFRPRLEKELDKFTDLKAAKGRPRKSAEGGDGPGTGSRTVEGAEGEKKEVVVRGVKRVKRDDVAGDEEEDDQDQDQDQDGEDWGGNVGDGDEVEEEHDEDATEEEEEDDEDEEDGGEGEDIDRVEDLDRGARARRMVDPDAAGDETESEDERPRGQLRADLGLG